MNEFTRFVILEHRTPWGSDRKDHFDLMVERPPDQLENPDTDHRLATWAFESPIDLINQVNPFELPLMFLPDHRTDYLDYEGSVSGNFGHVRRVLAGSVTWVARNDSNIEFLLSTVRSTWRVAITADDQNCIAGFSLE